MTKTGMAAIFPKDRKNDRDINFCNRAKFKHIMTELGLEYKKLNGKLDWNQLDKFLLVPGVESAFVLEEAEDYMNTMRAECKPVEHKDKSNKKLLEELKTSFMHRVEKMNMSLQAFHDSLAHDEKARHLIYENMNKFKELE